MSYIFVFIFRYFPKFTLYFFRNNFEKRCDENRKIIKELTDLLKVNQLHLIEKVTSLKKEKELLMKMKTTELCLKEENYEN